VKNYKNRGLFITDFDGTLLRSDGTFARRDLEALDTLARRGVRTAVATGRSIFSFNRSPGAGLPVDYIIFTTGAGVIVRSEGKLMYKVSIASEAVARVTDFFLDGDFDFMLHRPVPENHRFLYRRSRRHNTDFETRLELYREFGEPLNSAGLNGFGEASQFLAIVPENETHETLARVRNSLPELSVIHTTSPLDHTSTWIEVFHPDVSKSRTAAWLASELNVAVEDTMAIGNDYNDSDLLEWAAKGFVVANAPKDLKARFQSVASHNDCGVADAVDCWLEKRR